MSAEGQDIGVWEERLEAHFSDLRSQRKAEGSEHPVFALEHGLSPKEVGEFMVSVRRQISLGKPRHAHWLAWVVYAAELGYEFSGSEYWRTFEEKTPKWHESGDRNWVRECFWKFKLLYGGATPQGPWAEHFTIICWPITHAILPRDLQHHLAKALFEIRMRVSSEVLSSPEIFGQMIKRQAWGSSSRFEQFTQDTQLTGQIASALLLHKGMGRGSSILPSTLERIAGDLESKRSAREWMKTARSTTQERIRPVPAIGARGSRLSQDADEDQQAETTPKRRFASVEPRLLLKPSESEGNDSWVVLLELPDFSEVLSNFPECLETLRGSRCKLRGSSGQPIARGRLLRGPQRVRLVEWPGGGKGLLQFDRPSDELDYLLTTECSLRPGPRWLFKLSTDNVAHELRAPLVRAGNSYILLCEDQPSATNDPAIQEVQLDCSGITALSIDLPGSISPSLEKAIGVLELSFAGAARIWPAGLPPARWDGEGSIEWLSTETPCLGLLVDHPVESVTLQLGSESLVAQSPTPGEPLFVELPRLSPGRHLLKVSSTPRGRTLPSEPTTFEVQIREPRPWSPGQRQAGPLEVIVDPPNPTLEQLWQGEVDIEVNGPRKQQVECSLTLLRRGADGPLVEQRVFRLALPISTEVCREKLKNAQAVKGVYGNYDLADHATLQFSSEVLGEYTLSAEREHTALRWAVGRSQQTFSLRVIDDTGDESQVVAEHYPFNHPDQGRALPTEALKSNEEHVGEGGLYVMKTGSHEKAIVVPAGVKTLADLRVNPESQRRQRRSKEVLQLVEVLDLWACARVTGDIPSRAMRGSVLTYLKKELFNLVTGSRKRIEEDRLLRNAFQREAARLAALPPLDRVAVLAEQAGLLLGLHERHESRGLSAAASQNGELHWLSELALRLSSWPAGVRFWAGLDLPPGVSLLLLQPSLLRAATRMVEVIDHEQGSTAIGAGAMREGWGWL